MPFGVASRPASAGRCSPPTRPSCSTGACSVSRPTRPRRKRCSRRCRGGLLALHCGDAPETLLSSSEVRFRATTRAERAAYCRSGEPLDKAGGYGIQGRAAMFVEHLAGSYSGVVGLPLFETAALLARCGVALWGVARTAKRSSAAAAAAR